MVVIAKTVQEVVVFGRQIGDAVPDFIEWRREWIEYFCISHITSS
jgi:hypothetical protein